MDGGSARTLQGAGTLGTGLGLAVLDLLSPTVPTPQAPATTVLGCNSLTLSLAAWPWSSSNPGGLLRPEKSLSPQGLSLQTGVPDSRGAEPLLSPAVSTAYCPPGLPVPAAPPRPPAALRPQLCVAPAAHIQSQKPTALPGLLCPRGSARVGGRVPLPCMPGSRFQFERNLATFSPCQHW